MRHSASQRASGLPSSWNWWWYTDPSRARSRISSAMSNAGSPAATSSAYRPPDHARSAPSVQAKPRRTASAARSPSSATSSSTRARHCRSGRSASASRGTEGSTASQSVSAGRACLTIARAGSSPTARRHRSAPSSSPRKSSGRLLIASSRPGSRNADSGMRWSPVSRAAGTACSASRSRRSSSRKALPREACGCPAPTSEAYRASIRSTTGTSKVPGALSHCSQAPETSESGAQPSTARRTSTSSCPAGRPSRWPASSRPVNRLPSSADQSAACRTRSSSGPSAPAARRSSARTSSTNPPSGTEASGSAA